MKTFTVAKWESDKNGDAVLKQLKELGKKEAPIKAKKKRNEKRKLKKIIAKEKSLAANSTPRKVNNNQNFLSKNAKKNGNCNNNDSKYDKNLNQTIKKEGALNAEQKNSTKTNNFNKKEGMAKSENAKLTKTEKHVSNPSISVKTLHEKHIRVKQKNKSKSVAITTSDKNLKLQAKMKTVLENQKNQKTKDKKSKVLPLREKMMEKLKAAKFRFLNEQIYTTTGQEMHRYFKTNIEDYQAYHEGYKQQVCKWPLNPLSVIIKKVNKLPTMHVIADFGCGEAQLAKSVVQKVHSFDLVAANDLVTACDMAHVPLTKASVDVAVFCLSLMGTNLQDYITEANRVLKTGGILKIAEVESRFESVETFIKGVEKLGFTKIWKDLSHNLFYFLDFKKVTDVAKKKTVPEIKLQPCLYKKR